MTVDMDTVTTNGNAPVASSNGDAKAPLLPPPPPAAPSATPSSKYPPSAQSSKPRFAKLTLPGKHDNLSLVTRLWLQSRLIQPEEREKDRKAKGKEKDRPIAAAADAATATVEKTPVEKKLPLFRAAGRGRPFTLAEVWIWLDLARVLTPYLRVALRHAHPIRLAIYVLKMVIDALQPTAKLYAQSQLYDLVEEALSGAPAPWLTAVRIGSAGLMIHLFDELMDSVFNRNSKALHDWIEYALEKAYLTMQLNQPLQATDEVEAAQVFEAGVFAGLECAQNYNDGPWGLINGLGGAFAKSVDLAAKVTMIVNALGGWRQLRHMRDGRKGTQTAVLLALAFAPTLLQLLRERAYTLVYKLQSEYNCNNDEPGAEAELETFMDIATGGTHKQEIVLFGMRDWVLEKWDSARQRMRKEEDESPNHSKWVSPVFGCAEDVLRTIFYVLLATKTIDTGLTLGSIHLYQNTATALVWSVRSLKRNLDQAWQSIFYAAAFVGAIEPVVRGPMIDYETVRVPGGMRIEAKNLTFTYSGSAEPTLQDINLVVERGETLAIVGYNGGGKTTLVKVLLGLYALNVDEDGTQNGQLLINDIESSDYDSATVHLRQSVLFQDFARYDFSFKDNVGVGDVRRMDDVEAINAAIDAGGAQAIRDKIDLEGSLDPYGEPRGPRAKAVSWQQEDYWSDSDEEDSDEEHEKDDEKDEGKAEVEAEATPETTPSTPSESGSDSPPATGASTPAKKKKKASSRTALSGGQWQRVGLARAFMRAGHADLVVFDEPSAALDPKAEAELFANIHGLSRAAGATTIYISHRFNTVRKADKIALVEHGKIAEYGSHAELMALKGQYYDLFQMQAEGYLG